jgi:DNA-binding transcriptional ArsR family regulator
MSPADLSKSRIGRGIRISVYSYHFKELERWGLLEVDQESKGRHPTTRYRITDRLTQSTIDAAALDAISEVLATVPEPLAKWLDGPFIEEIGALVGASGRSPGSKVT